MGYIEGTNRAQGMMFPMTVDEYIDESNEVRAIGAFLEALDFKGMKFNRAEPAETGRPGYDPRKMMGLYLWGHMNRLRSSRKLEKECVRNLEAIWLMEGLRPDFKTISEFRRENGEGIKQVVVKFRLWAMEEKLFGGELVAVDGSKFKAVNSTQRNYTKKKLAKLIAKERGLIEKYLKEMDEADKEEEQSSGKEKVSAEGLKKKLEGIKGYLEKHEKLAEEMKKSGEGQISQTDEESRLMTTQHGMDVCYNVQTAVDDKNKLISAYEVTNDCNDKDQLAEMAKKAKEALGVEELTVVVDGGYYEGNNLKECEDAGIKVYMPVPESTAGKGRGLFPLERFEYKEERDVYVCPQGEGLSRHHKQVMHGKNYNVYLTKACAHCPLKAQCTKSKTGRKIRRWEHHDVINRLIERSRLKPEMMKKRKSLVEHPFGTIKRVMDAGYFLLKGRKKVGIEVGLTVLAYNMKRVINIMGVGPMIESMNKAAAWAG
jgi:transposase